MRKGFSRFSVVLLAGLMLGSSAFAMQQLLPLRVGEQVVHAELIKAVDKPAQQEQSKDILPVVKAAYNSAGTVETVEPADKKDLDKNIDVAKQGIKMATITATKQPSVPATKTDKPPTNTSTRQQPTQPAQTTQVATEKPASSRVVAAPRMEAVVVVRVEEKTTPAKPYIIRSSRTFQMVSRIVATNTGEVVSNNVRIEVPLISTSSLYNSKQSESFSIEPAAIKTAGGTRVGVFMLGNLEPGGVVVVEIRTQVRTSIIEFLADYVPTNNNKTDSYLSAESGIESNNGQIINLSNQITQGLSSDWDQARAITHWVAANIRYDATAANRNRGALLALQTRRGVCEDYAALCVALARAANIPARIVYGYTDNGTHWPVSGTFALRGFRHAWVEYNLAGRGWVPADPTRSNSSRLFFGTLPHNRYIVQNYNNLPLRGTFSGGNLSLSLADSLE